MKRNAKGDTQGIARGQQQTRAAQARRRKIVRLYRQGLTPMQIGRRLKLARTTVHRHLAIAGVPRVPHASRQVVPIWKPGRRRPYWELHTWRGASDVVLGRKFCPGCGHWRQLLDFTPDPRAHHRPLARCAGCTRRTTNYYREHWSDEQRARARESWRFADEARRRKLGVSMRQFKTRQTVVDIIEGTRLPLEPLLDELARYDDGELTKLAAAAGVSPRALYRYRYGESGTVRIDVADKLAVAMGKTSSLIWVDQW